jgi:hypothetical protein
MVIKEIAAGTTEKFQLNYVPEKLIIVAQNNAETLKEKIKVKVTPLGVGVICDLDEIGVSIVNSFNRIGGETEDGLVMILLEVPLADGLVPDRVTDYEIANGSGGIIEIYAPVSKKATLYVKSMQQTLLANSQVVFEKFLFLGFADTSNDSQATVDTEDGTSHTYSLKELSRNYSKRTTEERAVVYNDKGTIKKVTVIPDAQITGYKLQYVPL